MSLGIGISLVINVDTEGVKKSTLEAFELGLIDAGRKMLGESFNKARNYTISANGKTYVAWRTGNLAQSLGIAVSPTGQAFYGPLHRMDGQVVGSQGIPGASKNGPQVAIASSSGYGRWVHEGTSKVPARPFVLETVLENSDSIGTSVSERMRQAGL